MEALNESGTAHALQMIDSPVVRAHQQAAGVKAQLRSLIFIMLAQAGQFLGVFRIGEGGGSGA